MFHLFDTKRSKPQPASYSAGASAGTIIDTLGFSDLMIAITFGGLTSASNVPTVIQLQESDTTFASNFVSIAGSSQTSAITAAATAGAAAQIVEWDLQANTGTRKRYIQPVVTVAIAQTLDVDAVLGRAQIGVVTAADKGVTSLITI